MGSLVAELAEKLSAATNSLDFDEQTMFLNTSANTVGIGTNAPASKFDVRGTMQVGLDGTGYDVKFFGDTASAYMLWDESEDDLVLGGVAGINVSGTGTITGTLATAAQGNVTSLGTLTTLTVDNVITNGTTIGHTSDTDLLTLASGGLTIAGTITVGVDDAGHDVIFYGNSASSNMTWDTSEDDLILNDARLFLDQDDNVTSLEIDSEATSSHCININSAGTTGRALYIESNALTTGDLMKLYMNSSDTGSRSLLNLVQDHASASGTTVLRVQSDGTGDIVNLFDGGTEVFTVLDGGKVGIGTASPDVIFHVFSSSASVGPYIESTYADASLKLIAKNDATSMLDFGDSDSVNVGRLEYNHVSNWLKIKTNGTEAIRIISDQKVGIGSTAPNETLDVGGTFAANGYKRMAWGNFNQQSGSQTLASPDHNVSSVTDIGVGLTTVTLSITMGNITYNVVSGMAYSSTGSGVGNTGEYSVGAVYNKSTTAFSIVGLNHNDGSTSMAVDLGYICFICIGD